MVANSKIFGGRQYTLVTVLDPKAKAKTRASQLRREGRKARIVEVAKAPKGEAGYTRTRWAVYARD